MTHPISTTTSTTTHQHHYKDLFHQQSDNHNKLILTPQRKDETFRKQILEDRLSKSDTKNQLFINFIDHNKKLLTIDRIDRFQKVDKELKYTGCNCRKSQCLKMYCTCFAEGKMCDETCLCDSCKNDHDNMDRSQAINEIIEKDPFAFSKKDDIKNVGFDDDYCNCRKSNCTKKYCDCYRRGRVCGGKCNCLDCNNGEKQEKEEKVEAMRKRLKKQ